MSTKLDILKDQINMQTEKRQSRLEVANEYTDAFLKELKELRRQFYHVALKGLDMYLIRTINLEFLLPYEIEMKSVLIEFNQEGIKILQNDKNNQRVAYDSVLEDRWLEVETKAKIYNFIKMMPEMWMKALYNEYNKAVEKKLEKIVFDLQYAPVFSMDYDKYANKKIKKQALAGLKITDEDLTRIDLKSFLARRCCDDNKEPILVVESNLYILDEERMPTKIRPDRIAKGMYLYEQYQHFIDRTEEYENLLRGLSTVEYSCYKDNKLVVVSKDYIVSNIDFNEEYYAEKKRRKQLAEERIEKSKREY